MTSGAEAPQGSRGHPEPEAGGPRAFFALVESNTTGTGRLFAAAARARGLRPVVLSTRPERYPWVAEDGVEVAWADTSDPEAVALVCARLAGREGLAGVLTSSEYSVAVAARAAARLGLPGPEVSAVEQCRDKRRQRVVLQRAGVPVPAFEAVGSVRAAIAAAADIGLPVVCKPADGTGSRGVRLCTNLSTVAGHARRLLSRRHDERGRPALPWLLVEQYVDGAEVSVESFGLPAARGLPERQRIVGVTDKHLGPLPAFVETGHDFPSRGSLGQGGASTRIRAEDPSGKAERGEDPSGKAERAQDPRRVRGESAAPAHEAVAALAGRAVAALGLEWGPAHTELRLSPSGPVVIEVNPRLAGGQIPVLVRLAAGVDLVGAAVDLATGAEPHLPEPGPCSHLSLRRPAVHPTAALPAGLTSALGHASIRFLVAPQPGVVFRVDGLAAAAAEPGVVDVRVHARPGDRVGGTGSFLDRLGYVIAVAPKREEARRAAERGLAALVLELVEDAALPESARAG